MSTTTAAGVEQTELSEYELLRQKNIERNKCMLESLGFDGEVKTTSRKPSSLSSKKRPREQKTHRTERLTPIPQELLRRSARAAKLPAPDYKEPVSYSLDAYDKVGSNKRCICTVHDCCAPVSDRVLILTSHLLNVSRHGNLEVDLSHHQLAGGPGTIPSISTLECREPPAADTSRALDADLQVFLSNVSAMITLLDRLFSITTTTCLHLLYVSCCRNWVSK